MIFRTLFLFLCFSAYSFSLFSQTPGFTGKRFILSAEAYAFPSVRFIFTADRNFIFHKHLGISTEYVLNRRFSAGVVATRLNAPLEYDYQNRKGNALLTSTNFGVHLKIYTFLRRGNIAPVGPYQKLEIQYLRYHMTDLDRAFYSDGREALGALRDWVVSFTIGTQHVLPPRLTYKWGIQGGWILNVGQVFPFSEADKYLSNISTSRLRDHFAFNVTVGIGYLLF